MINKDLIEQVTSLVDNEIRDKEEVERIRLLLEKNDYLKIEFEVQSFIKSSLRTRFGTTTAPEYLKKNIISELSKAKSTQSKKKYFSPERFSFLLKPQFSLPLIIFLVLIYLFLPKPQKDFAEIIKKQSGNSNMYVQAEQNFKAIISGNLTPQFVSNDSNIIKRFFHEEGVKYQTFVPQFKDLELIGGVVSENNGTKFAHHIYKCKTGKYIYMYQAPEESIKTDKTLRLSDELVEWIESGKNVACISGKISILIWKHRKNYVILLSNEDMKMVKARFLAEK